MTQLLNSRLVGSLGRLKLLPQVLVVDLGIAAQLEHDKPDGRLGEDEHDGDWGWMELRVGAGCIEISSQVSTQSWNDAGVCRVGC